MHSKFAPPRPRGTYAHLPASRRALLARHALWCQRFASEPLDCTRVGLRPSVPAASACSLPAATGARRVAVRRLLLMLLPRRAVVPARGGTQLEGGVGDRRAGSLSSADAASRLGGGSCFAARARRRTRLRSRGSSKERTRWQSAGLVEEGEPEGVFFLFCLNRLSGLMK